METIKPIVLACNELNFKGHGENLWKWHLTIKKQISAPKPQCTSHLADIQIAKSIFISLLPTYLYIYQRYLYLHLTYKYLF